MAISRYDVFISYRRQGGDAQALFIREKLLQRNVRVFLDISEPKKGYSDEELLTRGAEAPNSIVILLPHALESRVGEDGHSPLGAGGDELQVAGFVNAMVDRHLRTSSAASEGLLSQLAIGCRLRHWARFIQAGRRCTKQCLVRREEQQEAEGEKPLRGTSSSAEVYFSAWLRPCPDTMRTNLWRSV
jgi:hypothetical protein